MSSDFADHFSGHARSYALHRPRYPAELFAWLAAASPRHGLAWDVATGNGQAAAALAVRFDRVFATDASAAALAVLRPDDEPRDLHFPLSLRLGRAPEDA
jgi:ubiquinone/menaquinone biosynthesis C-methylase UbiE